MLMAFVLSWRGRRRGEARGLATAGMLISGVPLAAVVMLLAVNFACP